MSIQPEQLRDLIRRTLRSLEPEVPYSEDAVELLMLTAAAETHCGSYLKQVGGPALGIFQMEPRTEHDIYHNYLAYKDDLMDDVSSYGIATGEESVPDLEANIAYQIVMARVHYCRAPAPLPNRHDLEKLAYYWKRWWNTDLGKGVPDKAVMLYKKYGGINA